ncbi:MAG TPA: AAA family ATPase [Polyangia bacterium]
MPRALRAQEGPPATLGGAMVLPASADYQAAMAEALRLATAAGRAATSVDILLGMLHAGGAAARLLAERGVSATAVEILGSKVRPDYGLDPAAMALAGQEIALGLSAAQTTSLHLLLALLRGGGAAALTLKSAGVDPAKLRGVVMRMLTGPGNLHERRLPRSPAAPSSDKSAPSTQDALSIVPGVPGVPTVSTVSSRPAQPTGQESPTEALDATARAEIELHPVDPPHVPVLYREREVGRLLDLLQAKTARIIAIVGDPGSGRTALLSALAAASLQPPVFPSGDMGTQASAGALLQALHRSAPLQVPIVLEGAAWLGPEGSDGVLQLLACAGAGRRWILCLTPADLRRIELATPDLGNALESVLLPVPDPAMLREMIETGLAALADENSMGFAADVTHALLRLSVRYPCERAQPGRALAIAEIALARAQRMSVAEVSARDIAAVVGDASGVPASQLLRDDDDRFRTLEERLADRVVGHVEARTKIASVLRRSYAGFRGRKPLASFLLLGPSGVGKTETARAIAESLFDGESALVRIDLSEYSEAHSIARLIGSPPGYVARRDLGRGHALGACERDFGDGKCASRLRSLARVADGKAQQGVRHIRSKFHAVFVRQGSQPSFDHLAQHGGIWHREQHAFEGIAQVRGGELDAPQIGGRKTEDPASPSAGTGEQLQNAVSALWPEPSSAFENDGHLKGSRTVEGLQ